MDKETSSRVSSIASRLIHITPATILDAHGKGHSHIENLCDDIQTIAASAMSQDTTPGQTGKSVPMDFYDRLLIEYAELSARHDALTEFLGKGAKGIDDEQHGLLHVQVDAMSIYRRALKSRIDLLPTDRETMLASESDHKTTATRELGEPVEIGGDKSESPIPFDC